MTSELHLAENLKSHLLRARSEPPKNEDPGAVLPLRISSGPVRPGEPWRLQSHRSIPYASGVEARVALRCDHRGCIAFGKQLDAMR